MWAANTDHLNEEKQKFLAFVRRNEKLGAPRVRERQRRRQLQMPRERDETSVVNHQGYVEYLKGLHEDAASWLGADLSADEDDADRTTMRAYRRVRKLKKKSRRPRPRPEVVREELDESTFQISSSRLLPRRHSARSKSRHRALQQQQPHHHAINLNLSHATAFDHPLLRPSGINNGAAAPRQQQGPVVDSSRLLLTIKLPAQENQRSNESEHQLDSTTTPAAAAAAARLLLHQNLVSLDEGIDEIAKKNKKEARNHNKKIDSLLPNPNNPIGIGSSNNYEEIGNVSSESKQKKRGSNSNFNHHHHKEDLKILTISNLSIELDGTGSHHQLASSRISRSKVLLEEKLRSLEHLTIQAKEADENEDEESAVLLLNEEPSEDTMHHHHNIDTLHFASEAEFSNWLSKNYKDPRKLLEVNGSSSGFFPANANSLATAPEEPVKEEAEEAAVGAVSLPFLPGKGGGGKTRALRNPHKKKPAEKKDGQATTSGAGSSIPSLPRLFQFYPHVTKSQRRHSYRAVIQNAYESKMMSVHKRQVQADVKALKKDLDSAYHNSVELPNHERDLRIKKLDQDVVHIPFGQADSLPELPEPRAPAPPHHPAPTKTPKRRDTSVGLAHPSSTTTTTTKSHEPTLAGHLQDLDRLYLPEYNREVQQAHAAGDKKAPLARQLSLKQAQLVEEVVDAGEIAEIDKNGFEYIENEYDLFNPALSYAKTMRARRMSGIDPDEFNFDPVTASARIVLPQVGHNSPIGDEVKDAVEAEPVPVEHSSSSAATTTTGTEKKTPKSILVNRRHSFRTQASSEDDGPALRSAGGASGGESAETWVHEAVKQRLNLINSDDYLQGYLFGEDEFIPEEYYTAEDELAVAAAESVVEPGELARAHASEPAKIFNAKSAGKRALMKLRSKSNFTELLSKVRSASSARSHPEEQHESPDAATTTTASGGDYRHGIGDKGGQRELSAFLKDFNYYESFNKVHRLNAYVDIINHRKLSLIDEKSYKYSNWVNKYLQMSRENSAAQKEEAANTSTSGSNKPPTPPQ